MILNCKTYCEKFLLESVEAKILCEIRIVLLIFYMWYILYQEQQSDEEDSESEDIKVKEETLNDYQSLSEDELQKGISNIAIE